jgi:hypothetical protein
MLPNRWNACKNIYENEKVNAKIKTYENIGHEISENTKNEIVSFFMKLIEKNQ